MTDIEMAEEWVKDNCDDSLYSFRGQELRDAYLAGLKAGRPKWHKVADGDLPKYCIQVLSDKGSPVIYKHDCFSWFEYSPNADNIKLRKWEGPIAWCEIPKYTEE